MRHRILTKFVTTYLLCFLLVLILFFSIVPGRIDHYLQTEKAAELLEAAENLASDSAVYACSYQGTDARFTKHLLDDMTAAQKSDIWLTDASGRILMGSSLSSFVTQYTDIPNLSPAPGDRAYWVTGDFFGMFHRNTLSVIVPVTERPCTTDFVIFHFSLNQLNSEAKNLNVLCFYVLIIVYIISFIFPFLFYLLLYRPLKNTVALSAAYADGKLGTAPFHEDDGEFGQIQANLHHMAVEIRQSGEYQRKFISNISHDFRSPLTSIKGYTQALLDGTVPAENQEKYLTIILNETERLSSLTQNILTINNLNESGVLLDLSIFDINSIIRSIVLLMEIQCRKKDIHIVSEMTDNELTVSADKEKIQQVIYNLLDNAIKFSNPHSTITLRTTRKGKNVFVSIKDTGAGIPADQIPKIWNRFYKTDPSRGKDKMGTGLGLSIVKEIIQAHDQDINVISTEGVGSEFIFTLDKA